MALAYRPPSVSVTEVIDPTLTPLVGVAASICLVGLSQGEIQQTDAIALTATDAIPLPSVPDDATMASDAIISVTDAVNPGNAPNGYLATTDYTFNSTTKTVTRVSSGAIPAGATVYVVYTYVPANYFHPIRLDNMQDIEARFGSSYNTDGTAINSALTYGAGVAFENGATDVVLLPLSYNSSGTLQQPNDTQAAASATWATCLALLRDIEDINILVPIVGQSQTNVGDAQELAIFETVQDHLRFMATQGQMMMAFIGEDSSASNSVAQPATLQSHALTLAARYGGAVSEQLVFVSPSKFTRATPGSLVNDFFLGGQYVAAAISGMIAARSVSQALTRQTISGITSIALSRTKTEMNADAQDGLCVIWQRGSLVQVRHGITLDNTSTVKREISIVRAKHRVMESVRLTMEEQVIGQVIADGEAPSIIAAITGGVLDDLRTEGDIVDFSDISARTLSLDPTEVEVRFSYRPAFPVNYISVVFSLDLTTGAVGLPDTTQADVASSAEDDN